MEMQTNIEEAMADFEKVFQEYAVAVESETTLDMLTIKEADNDFEKAYNDTIEKHVGEVGQEGIVLAITKLLKGTVGVLKSIRKAKLEQYTNIKTVMDQIKETKGDITSDDTLSEEAKNRIIHNFGGAMLMFGNTGMNDSSLSNITKGLSSYSTAGYLTSVNDFLQGKNKELKGIEKDTNGLDFIFKNSSKYLHGTNIGDQLAVAQRGFVARKLMGIADRPIVSKQIVGFNGDTVTALIMFSKGGKLHGKLLTDRISKTVVKKLHSELGLVSKAKLLDFLKGVESFGKRSNRNDAIADALIKTIKEKDTDEDATKYLQDRKDFIKLVAPAVVKASIMDGKNTINLMSRASSYGKMFLGVYRGDTQYDEKTDKVVGSTALGESGHSFDTFELAKSKLEAMSTAGVKLTNGMKETLAVAKANTQPHCEAAVETDVILKRMFKDLDTPERLMSVLNNIKEGAEVETNYKELIAIGEEYNAFHSGFPAVEFDSSLSHDAIYQVAVESSGNIFASFWEWIKKLWKSFMGSSASASDKADKKTKQLTEDLDELIGWLEEKGDYENTKMNVETGNVLRETHPAGIAALGKMSVTDGTLKDLAGLLNKIRLAPTVDDIVDYISGDKAKELKLKMNDHNGLDHLHKNYKTYFEENEYSKYVIENSSSLVSYDVVSIRPNSVSFLYVFKDGDKGKQFKSILCNAKVKESFVKSLAIGATVPTVKVLDDYFSAILSCDILDQGKLESDMETIEKSINTEAGNASKLKKNFKVIAKLNDQHIKAKPDTLAKFTKSVKALKALYKSTKEN